MKRPSGLILVGLVFTLAVGLAWAISRPAATAPPAPPRVILLGVDGLSWRVIQPLLHQGRLPNLARMMREGSSGVLATREMSGYSPVIWTSIATGRTSAEHGITGFVEEAGTPLTGAQRRVPALWNIAGYFGQRVLTVNWWPTWPAEPVNGVMITDRFDQPDSTATVWPPEEEAPVRSVQDQLTVPPAPWGGLPGLDPGITVTLGKEYLHDRRVMALAGRYLDRGSFDLALIYLYGTDIASHLFWQYFEPSSPAAFFAVPAEEQRRYGRVIPAYYELVDRFVGELLDRLGDRGNLILVSDHGFMPISQRQFEIAALLPYLNRGLPVGKLADFSFSSDPARKDLVWISDTGAVTLVRELLPAAEYATALQEAARRLEAIRTDDGKPLFAGVEIRPAPDQTTQPPDFRIRFNCDVTENDTVIIGGESLPLARFVSHRGFMWTGQHDLGDGVILARGPDIRRGQPLRKAGTYDVAPTVLALLGLPAGSRMAGSPLAEMLRREPPPAADVDYDTLVITAPRTMPADNGQEAVRQRLKALGYLH